MAFADYNFVGRLRRLLSGFTAYWQEIRTERHVNELPEHILKDIGWPDANTERMTGRGSVKDTDAGSVGVKGFHYGIEGRITSPDFGCLGEPPGA